MTKAFTRGVFSSNSRLTKGVTERNLMEGLIQISRYITQKPTKRAVAPAPTPQIPRLVAHRFVACTTRLSLRQRRGGEKYRQVGAHKGLRVYCKACHCMGMVWDMKL
jgi:hypothetical protein